MINILYILYLLLLRVVVFWIKMLFCEFFVWIEIFKFFGYWLILKGISGLFCGLVVGYVMKNFLKLDRLMLLVVVIFVICVVKLILMCMNGFVLVNLFIL